MKRILVTLAALMLVGPIGAAQPPRADSAAVTAVRQDMQATLGLVPSFFAGYPPQALPGAWEAFKGLQLSTATELPGKEKELIGLAVAAQVPCAYCVYAHTEAARANGASDEELYEAIAMAALTRQWSTVINGSLPDEAEFRAWTDAAFEHAGKAANGATPVRVVDAESARRDMIQVLGSPPPFLESYPAAALAGAWQELKALQISGDTALPARVKELIGLAVAAQIPCRYCSYAHTKAARLAGASEQQVQEALAMAAMTRHWSTWMHGTAADLATFRAEFDTILANAAAQAGGDTP